MPEDGGSTREGKVLSKPKSNVSSPSQGPSGNGSLLKNLGGLPPKKTPQQVASDSFPKTYKDAAGF